MGRPFRQEIALDNHSGEIIFVDEHFQNARVEDPLGNAFFAGRNIFRDCFQLTRGFLRRLLVQFDPTQIEGRLEVLAGTAPAPCGHGRLGRREVGFLWKILDLLVDLLAGRFNDLSVAEPAFLGRFCLDVRSQGIDGPLDPHDFSLVVGLLDDDGEAGDLARPFMNFCKSANATHILWDS